MRFKNRYLVCRVIVNDSKVNESLLESDIVSSIRKSLELNFGLYSLAKVGTAMGIDKYDKESGLFILRCMRDGVRDLLTSLLFLDSVKDTPSIIRVLDVKSTDRRALTSFDGFLKQSSI